MGSDTSAHLRVYMCYPYIFAIKEPTYEALL